MQNDKIKKFSSTNAKIIYIKTILEQNRLGFVNNYLSKFKLLFNKISQLWVNANVITKICLKMQNVILVYFSINFLHRKIRFKEFIELLLALFVVVYCSLPQISMPAIFEILVATFLKGEHCSLRHFQFFHCKNLPFLYKNKLDTSQRISPKWCVQLFVF